MSNHEVSPFYTTSFGFCCFHKNFVASNQLRISVLMHTLTTNSFPQCMIARLVINLLKCRDTITVVHQSITYDAFPH